MSASRLLRGFPSGFPMKVVLGVYVLAVAMLPLGHHDLACHLKSSTHCTTCVVGSSGESTSQTAALVAVSLDDRGGASSVSALPARSIAHSPSCGRAPPAAA
ncbi:MAG: hypothetical protein LC804_23645 [Acidobacteria bacterium]|nr:hypothetical protein [Acidobacteriota bacterium]